MNAIHLASLSKWRLLAGIFCAVWFAAGAVLAASPAGDVVGKITVGYQGWFACTGDGAPINSWWHYSGTYAPPTPTTLTNNIHCWPDMRQFTKGYQTGFANFSNGQPALLFSSYDDQVVQTHFRWMAENGLDTAALQRFNPTGGEGPTRNAMATKVMNAAQTYGRKFYIMYDISGWTTFTNEIKNDWTNVVNAQLHVTNSPAYAMQNGKPVVCIWGMGFSDPNHPWDAAPCLEVVNWFKSQGCYVIGGVPTHWRTENSDSRSNFLSAYSAFNMLSPWMVGRIGNTSDTDNFRTTVNVPDQAYCNSNGIDYQPCVLPGDTGQRAHGDFMWRQFGNMIQTGAQGLYISMFDEFNEGNQIACTAEDASMIPVGSSGLYFTLNQDGTACSSDYYLRLSGDGGRMLKGQLAFTYTRPTLPMLPLTLPAAPTNLTVLRDYGRLTVLWNATPGAVSYSLKRSLVSGGPYTTVATNVGLLSCLNTGLVNGVTYYYVVSTVNSVGESTNSTEVAGLVVGLNQVKANNNNDLELGASWVSGTAPGASDTALWDATVAIPANCTNTLGSAVTWNLMVISNPSAPIAVKGNTSLTLSNGIDMSGAAMNLTLDCGTIALGAPQTWTVAPGRTLTTGSSSSRGRVQSGAITKAGGGTWTISGTDDNASFSLVVNAGVVNLNKTSSSGAHSVGDVGLTVNNGGTARITGTGGDQIWDGSGLTLAPGGFFDLNGNSEVVATLSGTGGTVDNTAASKSATLTCSGNNTATFSGTIQNSGSGAKLVLVKAGTGTLTLNGANTYNGGTAISAGTLVVGTTNNVAMAYTNTGGTLRVDVASASSSLPMTSLSLGSSSPKLTFDFSGFPFMTAPAIANSGNLTLSGNVTVNVTNLVQSGSYVLLQYNGTRSGAGSFVAGSLPTGATLTDDTANKRVTLTYASLTRPRVVIPSLNTNEVVVAVATPQQYGAKGDGITDDSAAFQNAMNAVYNSGGSGGGVVFVPAGFYAFYTNLNIPAGVTLHGDWKDWTKGSGGLVGTTFKVYFGAGQATNPPFIFLNGSTALRGVNFWYPNQNAASIVAYPFTIGVYGDCVVQNVVLVNSYQGIQVAAPTAGGKHILSTVIGTPLYKGIDLDQIFDICHTEDIRFSPGVWPASLLTNAPAADGPHAAWMRANGTGLRMLRVDGELSMDTYISGYNVGIQTVSATNGEPGATFYMGAISNCATALLAQNMPGALGLIFTAFTLDGDIAVNRTSTSNDANVLFNHCRIVGRNGTAVNLTGSGWHSWMQFQNCTISNALSLNQGVFNLVNCSLSGATQCVMSASATRAAFAGCTFSPAMNIVNNGNANNLLLETRSAISNTLPLVYWTNVVNDYLARKPARTNLYVVTELPWGAYANGINDDTLAIQSALTAAGTNGGGLVYLPAGKYPLTNTLDVPGGVELRGANEMRHRTWPGPDGRAKGTVLQPYGGQGTTNGPAAIALEGNSGLVGVTISYESQGTNCYPFPATIQGRGGNIYVIGVCSPNPYYYVDLDTYTCTNHLVYMVDGWALQTGYRVGHGSSGSIVDCQGNWTYWIDNYDSRSVLSGSLQPPVQDFAAHNLQMYVLGDCTELLIKDFNIPGNTLINFMAEGGKGPNATLIGDYCDATIKGFVFDAAAPCEINAVNTPICVFNFGSYGDLAQATVGVMSTTNFLGTARFMATVLFAGPNLDCDVNGGEVDLELMHMADHAFLGSRVNGGVFHLVNNSAYIAYNGTSNYPPYSVSFGTNAGSTGKLSEFIGCYAYNGYSCTNANTNNPVNVWGNFGLSSYPTAPSGLAVTSSVAPVGLVWTAASGASSYNVKRALVSGGPYAVIATMAATNYTDRTVASNATYYYVVSTLNGFGESANSGQVSSRDVLLSRSGWVATASIGGSPGNAIDGNSSTRWSTGTLQANGQWFQIDMRTARTIFRIILDTTASANDYPRGYQVTLSNDGSTWGSSVATGAGSSAITTITFSPQTARYIRITQTGSASGNYWSIHELNVWGTPPLAPLGLTAAGGTNQVVLNWMASSAATSYNIKRTAMSGGPYATLGTSTLTNYTVLNALMGRTFYYAVSAVNAIGESADSNPVGATAMPGRVAPQWGALPNDFAVLATVLQGQTCVLEVATNLTLGGWIPVSTNTALAAGPLSLPDQTSLTNQCRFYRVRFE